MGVECTSMKVDIALSGISLFRISLYEGFTVLCRLPSSYEYTFFVWLSKSTSIDLHDYWNELRRRAENAMLISISGTPTQRPLLYHLRQWTTSCPDSFHTRQNYGDLTLSAIATGGESTLAPQLRPVNLEQERSRKAWPKRDES